MGYNVVCGILRGLGDSKTPLYFVALACVINIVLDVVLVGFCHLRAAGAAIATASSQGISFLTALWFLHKRGFHFPFSRRDIRLSPILSRRIFVLGAPIALQDALVNVSFLLITVIVNQMGVIASAALGVVEKIIVFAAVYPDVQPISGQQLIATMTAQNYGAGLLLRMKPLSLFGIGTGDDIRGIGLRLFSVFARYANRNLYKGFGCNCDGFRILAWI